MDSSDGDSPRSVVYDYEQDNHELVLANSNEGKISCANCDLDGPSPLPANWCPDREAFPSYINLYCVGCSSVSHWIFNDEVEVSVAQYVIDTVDGVRVYDIYGEYETLVTILWPGQ